MTTLTTRLARLGTSTLSDALDRMGIEGQALGIHAVGSAPPLVGPAFTVRMNARGLSGKSVGDYIDDVAEGEVVVIDNNGRLDVTVWGDILTTVAKRNRVGGTVIDGVCRDVARCAELKYPMFARGTFMRTGKDRVSAESYCEPIQIVGVRVEHGDWVIGDEDGVVVVPTSKVDQLVEVAEEISVVEENIRLRLAGGGRLEDIRRELSYHQLQRRPQ